MHDTITLYTTMHQNLATQLAQQEMGKEKELFADMDVCVHKKKRRKMMHALPLGRDGGYL